MALLQPDAPVSASASPDGYRIAVGGLPYFGRKMADLLAGEGWQARYLETRGWRPLPALRVVQQVRQAGLLYQIGGQLERFSRPHALLTAAPRPCVMHWTGSDVLYATRATAQGKAVARLRDGCVHWAGAPWLAEELAAIGVRAAWVPHSTVDAPATLPPLPEGPFTVLAYLRPGREAFYGAAAVRRVALSLPDVQVLVAGCERLPDAPANVRCLGWVEDMAPVYARAHALLRMTEHDGLAFMVQEALAYGRYAVWNHPFPGGIEALDAEAACLRLGELAALHSTGRLTPNLAGAAHVREHYTPARIRTDIRRRLSAIIEARP